MTPNACPLYRPRGGNAFRSAALAVDAAYELFQFGRATHSPCFHPVCYHAGITEGAKMGYSLRCHQQHDRIQTNRRRDLLVTKIDFLRIAGVRRSKRLRCAAAEFLRRIE